MVRKLVAIVDDVAVVGAKTAGEPIMCDFCLGALVS